MVAFVVPLQGSDPTANGTNGPNEILVDQVTNGHLLYVCHIATVYLYLSASGSERPSRRASLFAKECRVPGFL